MVAVEAKSVMTQTEHSFDNSDCPQLRQTCGTLKNWMNTTADLNDNLLLPEAIQFRVNVLTLGETCCLQPEDV